MQIDLSRLNFTRQELALYIKYSTDKKPDRLDSIRISWHVDGNLDRELTVHTGKNRSFKVRVLWSHHENRVSKAMEIDRDPMGAALADLHQEVSTGLRHYYTDLSIDAMRRPIKVETQLINKVSHV